MPPRAGAAVFPGRISSAGEEERGVEPRRQTTVTASLSSAADLCHVPVRFPSIPNSPLWDEVFTPFHGRVKVILGEVKFILFM